MIEFLIRKRLASEERRLGESLEYMRHILKTSRTAFFRFAKILPISNYRVKLPADAYHVARIVAARAEDCGTCVQIEVNLAQEQNIPTAVLQAVIARQPDLLPQPLQLIYRFVEAFVTHDVEEHALREQVSAAYGQEGLVELALAIGASRFLPMVKRTLGYGVSCSRVAIRVADR